MSDTGLTVEKLRHARAILEASEDDGALDAHINDVRGRLFWMEVAEQRAELYRALSLTPAQYAARYHRR